MIKMRREDDFLPRRLFGIQVTIYGLNLKKGEDEQFHDLDFQIEPSVSGSIDRSGAPLSEIKKLVIDRFDAAGWAAFYAHLFAIPVEEWKDNYARARQEVFEPYSLWIRDKANVNREISAGSPLADTDALSTFGLKWENGKLKVKKGEVEEINFDTGADSPYFSFDTESDDYKITQSYDPDAEAVEFALNKSCDVFLIPRPALHISYTVGVTNDTSVPGTFHQTIWNNFLGIVYRTVPTEYFPQWREQDYDVTTPVTDPDGYFQDFVDWMKGLTTARNFVFNYEYEFPTGSPSHSTDIGSPGFQSSAGYPILGADGVFRYLYRFISRRIQDLSRLHTIEPDGYPSDFDTSFFEEPSEPQLVAVIKQGSQFYYVWNTALTVAQEINAYTGSAGIFRIFYNNP